MLQKLQSYFLNLFSPSDGLKSQVEEAIEEAEIPEEYSRRFDRQAVHDKAQLIGREEELELIKKAFDVWQVNGNPLLIVSNPGEGVSSLINASSDLNPHYHIVENTSNINSRDHLLQKLVDQLRIEIDFETWMNQEGENKHVIVFENIERLFLRKIGGFSLMDDFLLLIHQSKKKVFWILTINQYSFYYLDQTKNLRSNFNSLINLRKIDNDLIREILNKRNESYDSIFLKPQFLTKRTLKSISSKTDVEKQEYFKNQFITKLLQFSKGNISLALLYWRSAVARISQKNVYLKTFNPPSFENLGMDELITLEAIHVHKSLSANELREVMRSGNRRSKLILERLLEKDLIKICEYIQDQEEYEINLFHYDAIIDLFKTKLNRSYHA